MALHFTAAEPAYVRRAAALVFFLHMLIMDSDSRHALCPGHSVPVTGTGSQPLSRLPLDLVVR